MRSRSVHDYGERIAEQVEQINFDPKVWENAEIAVTCSGKDHFLQTFPEDAKGGKEVVLDCTLKTFTDHVVPLAAPDKVDALIRQSNGHVVCAQHVYFGSDHQDSNERRGATPARRNSPRLLLEKIPDSFASRLGPLQRFRYLLPEYLLVTDSLHIQHRN